MGSFFALGFDGHLKGGMPLPFQNGLFVSSIYLFLVLDTEGQIGVFLRNILQPFTMGFSYQEIAILVVSFFMQSWAILQMPEFLGPSFNPFNALQSISKKTPKVDVTFTSVSKDNGGQQTKQKKNNSKKKKKQS